MPNRILREGILSSDRVEQLDWPAEVFYRRLMSKVDDHGLYDGRLSMLRTSLYPLRVDRVREADIARWIAACETAGVIALYENGGKPFLQMLDTKWQARSEAKYPLPTDAGSTQSNTAANSCAQVQATAPVFVGVSVVEDGDGVARGRAAPAPKKAKPKKTQIPEGFGVSESVRAWAATKGFDRLDEHLESFARKCKARAYEYADFDLAFMEAIREDWAKLRGRPMDGSAPPPSTGVPSKSAEHTSAYLAERERRVEEIEAETPEQRAATAARLKAARDAVVQRKAA